MHSNNYAANIPIAYIYIEVELWINEERQEVQSRGRESAMSLCKQQHLQYMLHSLKWSHFTLVT